MVGKIELRGRDMGATEEVKEMVRRLEKGGGG